jgi:hypothetical protein
VVLTLYCKLVSLVPIAKSALNGRMTFRKNIKKEISALASFAYRFQAKMGTLVPLEGVRLQCRGKKCHSENVLFRC